MGDRQVFELHRGKLACSASFTHLVAGFGSDWVVWLEHALANDAAKGPRAASAIGYSSLAIGHSRALRASP